MGAMKRLNLEYQRSGWDLTGFPRDDRALWRTLLPAAYNPVAKVEAKPKHDLPARPRQSTMFGD